MTGGLTEDEFAKAIHNPYLPGEELKVKCTKCDWEGNLDECFRDAKCPECEGEVEWV